MSPERLLHSFSLAGMNHTVYNAFRLREDGFETVFDPGVPVYETAGEVIKVFMHDFCGSGHMACLSREGEIEK